MYELELQMVNMQFFLQYDIVNYLLDTKVDLIMYFSPKYAGERIIEFPTKDQTNLLSHCEYSLPMNTLSSVYVQPFSLQSNALIMPSDA